MSLYKFVHKITEIKDCPMATMPGVDPDTKTLVFGDIDSQAHVLGYWMRSEQPQVGGYFAALKSGGAVYLSEY